MKPNETLLRNIVRDALCGVGWRLWVNTSGLLVAPGNRRLRVGGVGSADLVGWTSRGRFAAVELKVGRSAVLTDAQRSHLVDVAMVGGAAVLVWSLRRSDMAFAEVVADLMDREPRLRHGGLGGFLVVRR